MFDHFVRLTFVTCRIRDLVQTSIKGANINTRAALRGLARTLEYI